MRSRWHSLTLSEGAVRFQSPERALCGRGALALPTAETGHVSTSTLKREMRVALSRKAQPLWFPNRQMAGQSHELARTDDCCLRFDAPQVLCQELDDRNLVAVV